MRHPLTRLLAVLFMAAFVSAACDSPTGGGTTPKEQGEAQIGFALNLSGLPVTTLAVQVTASDITTPLVYNVPVVNGGANGNITVPAGPNRTITVRAFDAQGTLTHEGSAAVQQVRPGTNVNVTITLIPRAGNVPITINMGSLVMTVSRVRAAPAGGDLVGDSIRFKATVTHPDGSAVAGAAVRWASTNPAVATVDSTGLVTARVQGSTEIVATYAGFGATQTLTFVMADGTSGTPDQTAPRLLGMNISPDSAHMGTTSTVDVAFQVTAEDAGRGFYSMSVVLQSPDGATTRECNNNGYPVPGVTTRTCTITLSRYGQAGRWTVRELAVYDNLGNGRSFTPAELAAAGYDSGVTVTGTSVDAQLPELLAVDVTPDSITPGSGYSQATFRITATDALSGVEEVSVSGRSEDGYFGFGGGPALQVGPNTWESYVHIDSQYPPAGVVRLESVRIKDRAGNILYLDAAQLEARGMRGTLTIIR